MLNGDIISLPDKWEYPWYSAWDLAFHSIALSVVDNEFAKQQLELLLQALYLHPNGQMPASELNFGEVTPPVHAWAAMFLYNREKALSGESDLAFLKRVFRKLTSNFAWWVNQKDRFGKNVFEGGFLGLDSIGLFDRSQPLPTGGYIEVADGTAWMAFFCQSMLEMAVELAANDPSYQEAAVKFHRTDDVDCLGRESHRRRRTLGRSGWILLRSAATSGWHFYAIESPFNCRLAALVRDHGSGEIPERALSNADESDSAEDLNQSPALTGNDAPYGTGPSGRCRSWNLRARKSHETEAHS